MVSFLRFQGPKDQNSESVLAPALGSVPHVSLSATLLLALIGEELVRSTPNRERIVVAKAPDVNPNLSHCTVNFCRSG